MDCSLQDYPQIFYWMSGLWPLKDIHLCAWMYMFWFRFSILAPAKIRPGTKQKILLEGLNLSRVIKVSIEVYDYPVFQSVLSRASVLLKSNSNYSALTTIEVNLSMNVYYLLKTVQF